MFKCLNGLAPRPLGAFSKRRTVVLSDQCQCILHVFMSFYVAVLMMSILSCMYIYLHPEDYGCKLASAKFGIFTCSRIWMILHVKQFINVTK